eukprot:scaffold797_cov118-Skeletonema_dohrnii-CCMP3373.AAC.2
MEEVVPQKSEEEGDFKVMPPSGDTKASPFHCGQIPHNTFKSTIQLMYDSFIISLLREPLAT